MAQLRLNALDDVLHRKPKHMVETEERVSDYFGRNTFHIKVMREFLSEAAYKSVKSAIQNAKIFINNLFIKLDRSDYFESLCLLRYLYFSNAYLLNVYWHWIAAIRKPIRPSKKPRRKI